MRTLRRRKSGKYPFYLDLEQIHLTRQAESFERSGSRAAQEDELDDMRDQLAAVMLELQQKREKSRIWWLGGVKSLSMVLEERET